jgi:hypothetical protein
MTISAGNVWVNNMTANLTLNGASNIIDVAQNGLLLLNQVNAANGQQNNQGGIALGAAHNGSQQAILVEVGGEMDRKGVPVQGVADQVSIGGSVSNSGTVFVDQGDMHNITGKDAANVSFYQNGSANVILNIATGGTLNAAGTYQIFISTVKLSAPENGTADELEGAGLFFNATTALTIVDSGNGIGNQGTFSVQGSVTLGANTTTTLNYTGATNTADLLDVRNGTLTLGGTLNLLSKDLKPPTQALNFLDDFGQNPVMNGAFAFITGNLGGGVTYTGQDKQNNAQQIFST